MKETLNRLSRTFKHRALGLLLIRVGLGLVFLMHGYSKLGNVPGTERMFDAMGFGGGVGLFIAWLEMIGGAALILGVLTRLFAVIFTIEMVVAIIATSNVIGASYRAHELEIFLALVSLGIALTGSGKFSLFAWECHHCGGMFCKGKCCEGGKCGHLV